MTSFFKGTINSFKLQDGDIVESGLVETKENGMTEIPLNDANTMNEKPVKKVTIQDNKSNRYRNKQYFEACEATLYKCSSLSLCMSVMLKGFVKNPPKSHVILEDFSRKQFCPTKRLVG